jgi:hypothetical protein
MGAASRRPPSSRSFSCAWSNSRILPAPSCRPVPTPAMTASSPHHRTYPALPRPAQVFSYGFSTIAEGAAAMDGGLAVVGSSTFAQHPHSAGRPSSSSSSSPAGPAAPGAGAGAAVAAPAAAAAAAAAGGGVAPGGPGGGSGAEAAPGLPQGFTELMSSGAMAPEQRFKMAGLGFGLPLARLYARFFGGWAGGAAGGRAARRGARGGGGAAAE